VSDFGALCFCCLHFVFVPFSYTFHVLRPAKAPGFAYAWLELVSHRVFIGRMLAIIPQQRVSVRSIAFQFSFWFPYHQILTISTPGLTLVSFRDGACMLSCLLISSSSSLLS
jgi:hypothetical protein